MAQTDKPEKQSRGYQKQQNNSQNQNPNHHQNSSQHQNSYQPKHRQNRQKNAVELQERIKRLVETRVPPKFNDFNFKMNQKKSIFIKARVISVEEKKKEYKNTEQISDQKYLSVTLEYLFINDAENKRYELKVFPPNGIFKKDIEDQKREEHYNAFLKAQASIAEGQEVFVEIMNAKVKIENKKVDNLESTKDDNQDNKTMPVPEQQQKKVQCTIHLTEWTQVKVLDSITKFSDVKKIGQITANDKYVNVVGLVTDYKILDHKIPPQISNNKEPEKPPIQITVSDDTGSINFILPNIEKFTKRIREKDPNSGEQYLYFQKAQKQLLPLNEGESNVFLNIYITEKDEQSEKFKQKGFILELDANKHKNDIEGIKGKQSTVPNVSNKIWIVKQTPN